jgi:hypothetical protein
MPVVKKRNQQTESRLLLESDDPVELPPAEVEESAVVVQFDTFRPHLPELLEALRAGTLAEPVPVMLDGSTFVVHGATRSFWVKLWHSAAAEPELSRVERVQVISCLPSTRGLQVIVDDPEDYLDDGEEDVDDYDADDDDFEDDDGGGLGEGEEDKDDEVEEPPR